MELLLLFGFELVLILIAVVFSRVIRDRYLYGFSAVCAAVLLVGSVNELLWDGAFNYFRAVGIATCLMGAAFLAPAAWQPERRKCAAVGSAALLGFFVFMVADAFVPIQAATPVLLLARHHTTGLTSVLGPVVVILLPIAPAAGVLSLVRALRTRPSGSGSGR